MAQKERSLSELYAQDPERADAVVFGRKPQLNRRGFLNGTGLAAMGVAVGGTISFSDDMPAGLIPAAMAQGAPPPSAAESAPKTLEFPGKEKGLTVLGDRPLVADAGAFARRRHHAGGQVLHPQ